MTAQYTITLILPALAPKLPVRGHRNLSLYLRLKRLRDLLSDYRILARLVGYPAIHTWGIDTARKAHRGKNQWIEDAQVVVNTLYQPLENLAYLSSHDIIPLPKSLENQFWLWSCRCWAAHVALELYRLTIERDEHDKDEVTRHDWRRELLINLAYAPLTVHWSVDGGIGLDEFKVGLLGTIAGIASLAKAWQSSA
ncbi:hypothetical protein PYCC9005_004831 [Savitreella phatthalungensis]